MPGLRTLWGEPGHILGRIRLWPIVRFSHHAPVRPHPHRLSQLNAIFVIKKNFLVYRPFVGCPDSEHRHDLNVITKATPDLTPTQARQAIPIAAGGQRQWCHHTIISHHTRQPGRRPRQEDIRLRAAGLSNAPRMRPANQSDHNAQL